MEGPRSPESKELVKVFDFLNNHLRTHIPWSIASEYPTAFHSNNVHNMRIITENEEVLSHAVLKPLIIKSPHVIFKVGALGSVVTAESYRGHGLSTQIISDCLQSAKQQHCDFAILWTDLYDFYRRLGFELAGNELSFVLEQPFLKPSQHLRFSKDPRVAAEAILKVYNQHTVNTVRTQDEIQKFLSIPNTRLYTAWDQNNNLKAYAVEGKGLDLCGYIHEWGGYQTQDILELFNWVLEQNKSNLTIICPKHSENFISSLEPFCSIKNQGFLGMIKILDFDQLAAKIKRAFRTLGINDFVLEQQNAQFLFGFNSELFTVPNEMALVQLLFGPLSYEDLNLFSEDRLKQLKQILPLKFWVWGWDSV